MLEEIGVAKVFTPGATTHEITGWVAEHFAAPDRRDRRAEPGRVTVRRPALP